MKSYTVNAAAALIWVGLASVPAAGQVSISKELTEFEQVASDALDAFFRPEGALGVFDADFAAFDTPVNAAFTWSAPSGKQFEIVIPGDAIDARIGFQLSIGGSSGGVGDETIVPLTASFEDFSGPALGAPESNQLVMANFSNGLIDGRVVYDLTPGQTYLFSSVTAEGVIPAGYNIAHDTTLDSFEMHVLAAFPSLPTDDEPPLVRLVNIPEPSSLALLALGLLPLARRRRQTSINDCF